MIMRLVSLLCPVLFVPSHCLSCCVISYFTRTSLVGHWPQNNFNEVDFLVLVRVGADIWSLAIPLFVPLAEGPNINKPIAALFSGRYLDLDRARKYFKFGNLMYQMCRLILRMSKLKKSNSGSHLSLQLKPVPRAVWKVISPSQSLLAKQ